MNVRGLQRNVKNVVCNYNEAQVKVREATSNDPWGASSTLMGEIADLTFNVVAFSEIMQMIWKRLNDHGKNWRHVYKALVLLEYLIKSGSERVAHQCRDNIYTIQTLKDFQHNEDGKDLGFNVREKSKALVNLLKDEEKLRIERARALKARERFAQSASMSNSVSSDSLMRNSMSYHETLGGSVSPSKKMTNLQRTLSTEVESARPQTIGEEELHLQLALALSKEEADQEDRLKKNDDLRLQLAINESQKNPDKLAAAAAAGGVVVGGDKKSAIDDLLSLNINTGGNNVSTPSTSGNFLRTTNPWGLPVNDNSKSVHLNDPWSVPTMSSSAPTTMGSKDDNWLAVQNATPINDPWAPSPPQGGPPLKMENNDPWTSSNAGTSVIKNDPWSSTDESGMQINRPELSVITASNDPWQPAVNPMGGASALNNSDNDMEDFWTSESAAISRNDLIGSNNNATGRLSTSSPGNNTVQRRTPESFLGVNSNLVNLDALISSKTSSGQSSSNPFMTSAPANNPFNQSKPTVSMNQLRNDTFTPKYF